MAQVFLSYAREDRQRVEPLVHILESLGVTVFWDREVPPGAPWREVLNRELASARCVAVAWSSHSIESEWVLEEAEEGKQRGQLMPFLLDSVRQPLGFGGRQAADLTSWNGDPEHTEVRKFAQSVVQLVSGNVPVLPPVKPKQHIRRRALILSSVSIITAVIATFLWFNRPKNTANTSFTESTKPTAEVSSQESKTTFKYRRIYFQNFSTSTVEQSIWLVGSQGDWRGQVKDDAYHLCNQAAADTASFTSVLSYSEPGQDKVDQSDSKVSVKVRLIPPLSKYSSAGILYRASRETHSYFAFALSAGNSVSFVRNQDNHLKIVGTWELNGFQDGETAELRVEGSGAELRMYINGKHVHTEKDDTRNHGDPGVFAMGLGCFLFDDYSVYLPTQ